MHEAIFRRLSMNVYDLTIIGAGPTGLFAAFYAGMRAMKTKVIEALSEPGGQLTVLYPDKFIYDVAGFPRVLSKDLVKHLTEQSSQFKPTFCFNEQVRSISYANDGIIRLETDVQEHFTRTIIICAGVGAFSPTKLDAPGVQKLEGKGVFYRVQDKVALRGKRVLIVGGGDSAVDWALNLQHWAEEVTLIHRRDVFRAHESSVTSLFSSDVKVKLFHEVKEVHGEERVTSATIVNNKTQETLDINIDVVLVLIGFKTAIGPLKDWSLELQDNRILVNGRMETNLPGVYAAGDIVQPKDSARLNLICIGLAQGAIAVNCAKNFMDPSAAIYPGHSSDKRF
ncbi:MAG: NAD(P)/FAD-dependent oxidoreductase [Candidatus Bathyarchaeia archaeon]